QNVPPVQSGSAPQPLAGTQPPAWLHFSPATHELPPDVHDCAQVPMGRQTPACPHSPCVRHAEPAPLHWHAPKISTETARRAVFMVKTHLDEGAGGARCDPRSAPRESATLAKKTAPREVERGSGNAHCS